MTNRVTMCDKETGEQVEDAKIEARHHGNNYQAMISWRGITKIAFGDSREAAVQDAFDKFSGVPVVRRYDLKLVSGN